MLGVFFESTETPHPRLVLEKSLEQVHSAKVRPQGLGDKNLGIRNLPKQEIAYSHLTGGANQQIWVRKARSIEVTTERLFVDVCALALCPFGDYLPTCVDDLGTPPIVEGDIQF